MTGPGQPGRLAPEGNLVDFAQASRQVNIARIRRWK